MTSQPGFGDEHQGSQQRGTSIVTRSSEAPQDDLETKKARKREQDRLCQRRKREKDRENLRRLEARLNGLQNKDDPKVMLDLIMRHERDQEKLTRQADRLRQIESLLKTSLQDIGDDSASPPASGDMKIEVREIDHQKAAGNGNSVATMSPSDFSVAQSTPLTAIATPCSLPMYGPVMLTPQYGSDFGGSVSQPQQPMMQPTPTSTPATPSEVNNLTDAMSQVQGVGSSGVAFPDDAMDQHIIVMVVLHGWDAVTAYFHLDPLWVLLRQIDSSASSRWRKVERMVGMLSIRRMMKAFALGTQAMNNLEPKFLRPRPSQLYISHLPNGDYFPWPGVRERFVFESHKYCHDTFLSIFNSNTRFLWPHEFQATFSQALQTPNDNRQLFRFSDDLMKRFNNLRCWSVDAAFLAAYPEFAGDIPTYNSVPPRVEGKAYDGNWFDGQLDERDERIYDIEEQQLAQQVAQQQQQQQQQHQQPPQMQSQQQPPHLQPQQQHWAPIDGKWFVAGGVR